uniref:TP53-binding protein 1 n=1 Tax=Myripristis murdjan TaxID=586833 RepID=A0A667Z173_9TELE
MDPGGSELDSSLPQPENPCLIVEDSQPDSVALEDDPESSYRALLSRRLSNLQPTARSPVLVSRRSTHSCFATYPENSVNRRVPMFALCCSSVSLSPSRSEVSSSSSSEPRCQTGRQLSVQALLHSQGLHTSGDQDQQDSEILSSQEDMFDADKTGAAVDSTVSEPDNQGLPTATPAHTLRLLHLSGQGTLVQESLSQSSVDYVAPTPDNFSQTPLIVPSSPTEPENQHGADEPMDTSLPPDDRSGKKEEEPMETEPVSKPRPSASTPVSQNSPDFVLERTLSMPSQPEFSHDVFVPTQSQEVGNSTAAPQDSHKKKLTASAPLPHETQTPPLESAPSTLSLQLSVNTESCSAAQQTSEHIEDDSQATQIEEVEDNGVPSETKMAADSKSSKIPDSPKHHSESARTEESSPSQKSDTKKRTTAALNVQNVNVSDSNNGSKSASSVDKASLSQPKFDTVDLTVNSCVQETPSDTTASSLASQSGFSQTSSIDVVKSVESATDSKREETVKSQSVESALQECGTAGNRKAEKDMMDEGEQEEEVEEEVVMEEGEESTVGAESSGLGLALSQSQVLSPEPMEEESGEQEEENGCILVLKESEAASQILGKEASSESKTSASQPVTNKVPVSTNGHRSQSQSKEDQVAPGREAPEPEGLKDKSLSDSSGEIPFHFTLPKEGEVIGPTVSATPPLVNQLKQTPRHSTPIEITSFSEKSDVVGDVSADTAMAASDIVSGESGEDTVEKGDGKLSLRMKLVTPVEESSSDRFSLQRNSTDVLFCVLGSPSVFSRVRQVHRQLESESNSQPAGNTTPLQQRTVSQQTSFDGPGLRSPASRVRGSCRRTACSCDCCPGEPESPSFRRTFGPSHRRHVRTIQEVRTTITRIITDVYYEDGKEVDRKVTEETEVPVVDCQVLDGDISPCRTGSSMTSGDLADVSSLSSKASSLQHSSGGTSSSTGNARPDFIMPPSRGARSIRGGGQQQRGHRGHRFSSEDEPYTRLYPRRLPDSPTDTELPSHSDSLRSSPEDTSSAGSSFVGLRVVAKWSSNGYFYSGRIIKDAGEGRFRLRFDDGYECEVAGKDILLCDPIPLETEVTALLEDEYFSVGVVKGHKTESHELFYSVEREGQRQWYSRSSVILSLEQGNKLREQHSLGPYEPATPLAKASDISLDNLVEGKRRRRGGPEGQVTPNRSSSSSPRTPGPSGKRKLMSSVERTPAKRGRRGPGARAAQRVGVCNTSGSGTDLPGQSCDLAQTHGPLPQNTSLFMGFAFMLTASSESDRLTNTLASDDDEEYVQTAPYNKGYTESQLQAGGGFILLDFNEEQCKAAYQSLLIADQHCRTTKYLLCVASGVPCVSHIWVRDCCKENKLLNYRNYLLPAGIGPDDSIVEWHPRCSPFKSLRVLLVFEEPVELWAQLLTLSGASTVRQFQSDKDSSDIPAGKFDVVVTDNACPPLVQKSVTSQKVPLVSPEWLIQSLISGECLGYHSKPQYHHDYRSS